MLVFYQMETPPVIATYNPARMRDFYLRCLCAIAIGVVGFWWPNWYASRIPPELDSRIGMACILGVPFIIGAAIWATMAFRRAYRPRYLSAGLLLLVWAPALIGGARILMISLSVANLMRQMH